MRHDHGSQAGVLVRVQQETRAGQVTTNRRRVIFESLVAGDKLQRVWKTGNPTEYNVLSVNLDTCVVTCRITSKDHPDCDRQVTLNRDQVTKLVKVN